MAFLKDVLEASVFQRHTAQGIAAKSVAWSFSDSYNIVVFVIAYMIFYINLFPEKKVSAMLHIFTKSLTQAWLSGA